MTDRPDAGDGGPDRADPLGVILGDAAVWSEPDQTVEDRIVASVAAARPSGARPARWTGGVRRWLAPVAVGVAAAIVVLVAGSVVDRDDSRRGDGVDVALAASDLAPGAAAVATVTDTPLGTRIDLDVRGLAPAGADEYYELWLWDADGDAVSAGSFHLRGGTGSIELWAGVGLDDYPRITVTRQREGAGTAPSGDVVLRRG